MTFINARILRKRPNLFVTPKRNYGNLLIKYESGQNSPADSGRQLTSIHPEPAFTTNWTKSGLAISADLSAITDAHNSFYTYLCRDDGTTLATHQFAEGQTTTSLQFTETNYGTFSYQLKLGTTVVASHTETYVRPEPTFTTSWTKSGLAISAIYQVLLTHTKTSTRIFVEMTKQLLRPINLRKDRLPHRFHLPRRSMELLPTS